MLYSIDITIVLFLLLFFLFFQTPLKLQRYNRYISVWFCTVQTRTFSWYCNIGRMIIIVVYNIMAWRVCWLWNFAYSILILLCLYFGIAYLLIMMLYIWKSSVERIQNTYRVAKIMRKQTSSNRVTVDNLPTVTGLVDLLKV